MSLENLQIAALVHDIGKFYQRTGKNTTPNIITFPKMTMVITEHTVNGQLVIVLTWN